MKKEKYGFVYIWYDRKRKMFYIGCHLGYIDDGYICSSRRMRKAFRRRPLDFKRRILDTQLDRSVLLEVEYKWLQLIKDEELNVKYYNSINRKFGHWMTAKDKSGNNHPMYGKTHTEESRKKISDAHKGKEPWNKGKTDVYSEETKFKMGERNKGNTYAAGNKHSEETKAKMSEDRIGVEPWNKGKIGIYSEESLKRMSDNSKGQVAWNKGLSYEFSAEAKERIKERYKNKTWKIDKDTGKRVWVDKE